MQQMSAKIVKWGSIPVLLIASMFSGFAAGYKLPVDLAICLGVVILAQLSVRSKEYFWAAGFAAIVVVFSPLPLAIKIFFLLGLACIAAFGTLLAAFRTRPVAVV